MRNPQRNSTWRIVGIRPEFRAGKWIDKIHNIHNESNPKADPDFIMNAPAKSVFYDFQAQETVIGGVQNSSLAHPNARVG